MRRMTEIQKAMVRKRLRSGSKSNGKDDRGAKLDMKLRYSSNYDGKNNRAAMRNMRLTRSKENKRRMDRDNPSM